MKKTLLAAALLGSFAASAFAAPSVTLYGVVDTGLNYTHYRADDGKTASTDTFSEQSGQTASSRWGLRGDEKIGSVTVGFNLENGFNSDDGTETMSASSAVKLPCMSLASTVPCTPAVKAS